MNNRENPCVSAGPDIGEETMSPEGLPPSSEWELEPKEGGSVENRESVGAGIEKEEALLKEKLAEFTGLVEETKDAGGTPEDQRSRWDKIQDAYKSTQIKVNAAFATLSLGSMGTVMYAVKQVMQQDPQLAERLIRGGGWMTWGAIGTLGLGHAHNAISRKLKEKGYMKTE